MDIANVKKIVTSINNRVEESGMPLEEVATEVGERRDLYSPQLAHDTLKYIEDGRNLDDPPDAPARPAGNQNPSYFPQPIGASQLERKANKILDKHAYYKNAIAAADKASLRGPAAGLRLALAEKLCKEHDLQFSTKPNYFYNNISNYPDFDRYIEHTAYLKAIIDLYAQAIKYYEGKGFDLDAARACAGLNKFLWDQGLSRLPKERVKTDGVGGDERRRFDEYVTIERQMLEKAVALYTKETKKPIYTSNEKKYRESLQVTKEFAVLVSRTGVVLENGQTAESLYAALAHGYKGAQMFRDAIWAYQEVAREVSQKNSGLEVPEGKAARDHALVVALENLKTAGSYLDEAHLLPILDKDKALAISLEDAYYRLFIEYVDIENKFSSMKKEDITTIAARIYDLSKAIHHHNSLGNIAEWLFAKDQAEAAMKIWTTAGELCTDDNGGYYYKMAAVAAVRVKKGQDVVLELIDKSAQAYAKNPHGITDSKTITDIYRAVGDEYMKQGNYRVALQMFNKRGPNPLDDSLDGKVILCRAEIMVEDALRAGAGYEARAALLDNAIGEYKKLIRFKAWMGQAREAGTIELFEHYKRLVELQLMENNFADAIMAAEEFEENALYNDKHEPVVFSGADALMSLYVSIGDRAINTRKDTSTVLRAYKRAFATSKFDPPPKPKVQLPRDKIVARSEILLKCARITEGEEAGRYLYGAAKLMATEPSLNDSAAMTYLDAIATYTTPLKAARAYGRLINLLAKTIAADTEADPKLALQLTGYTEKVMELYQKTIGGPEKIDAFYWRVVEDFRGKTRMAILHAAYEKETTPSRKAKLEMLFVDVDLPSNKRSHLLKALDLYLESNDLAGQLIASSRLCNLTASDQKHEGLEEEIARAKALFKSRLVTATSPKEVDRLLAAALEPSTGEPIILRSMYDNFSFYAEKKKALLYLKSGQFDDAAECYIKIIESFAGAGDKAAFFEFAKQSLYLFAQEVFRTEDPSRSERLVNLCARAEAALGNWSSDDIETLRNFATIRHRAMVSPKLSLNDIVLRQLQGSTDFQELSPSELADLVKQTASEIEGLSKGPRTQERIESAAHSILKARNLVLTGLGGAEIWYEGAKPKFDDWMRLDHQTVKGVK